MNFAWQKIKFIYWIFDYWEFTQNKFVCFWKLCISLFLLFLSNISQFCFNLIFELSYVSASMKYDDQDFKDIRKIILIGDANTGKTNLVHCFTREKTPKNISPTVGVQFTSKLVPLENKRVFKAQIWDTAGQEIYKSMTKTYYRKVQGALVVFDVTRRSTFDHVKEWIATLREQTGNCVQIGLIGHKIDSVRREVGKIQGQQLAVQQHIFYAQTTINDLNSINIAFNKLIKNIAASLEGNQRVEGAVNLQEQGHNRNGCSC